jgi:hypothetical protein
MLDFKRYFATGQTFQLASRPACQLVGMLISSASWVHSRTFPGGREVCIFSPVPHKLLSDGGRGRGVIISVIISNIAMGITLYFDIFGRPKHPYLKF